MIVIRHAEQERLCCLLVCEVRMSWVYLVLHRNAIRTLTKLIVDKWLLAIRQISCDAPINLSVEHLEELGLFLVCECSDHTASI